MEDRSTAEALNAFVRNITMADVTVDVADGIALIHGSADSARTRSAIEDLIAAHDGVRAVENRLAIETGAAMRPSRR